MRTIKLTLSYDGTDFRGWQIQAGQPTIQGTLVDVLRKLTAEHLTVHAAGRTDSGVHALGQVAHFKTHSALTAAEFQRACNALLPPSIRVVEALELGSDFHARWNAQAKTYHYRIFRGRVVPPFLHRYVLHYPFPLDLEAMSRAARLFEGEHDFTSFAASSGSEDDDRERTTTLLLFSSQLFSCSIPTLFASSTGCHPERSEGPAFPSAPVREGSASTSGCHPERSEGSAFQSASVPEGSAFPSFSPVAPPSPTPDADLLIYSVRGRSFLRYMVRKLVGTLLDVGRGRLTPDDIPALFDLRDRSRSGPTVPPHGLFLVSVEYSEPWRL